MVTFSEWLAFGAGVYVGFQVAAWVIVYVEKSKKEVKKKVCYYCWQLKDIAVTLGRWPFKKHYCMQCAILLDIPRRYPEIDRKFEGKVSGL